MLRRRPPSRQPPEAAGPHRWYHAFQHWFVHAVLSLYGPTVVYNPYVISMKHNEHIPDSVASGDFMARQKPTAWAMRLFYVARVVLAPWWFGGAPLLLTLFLVNGVTGMLLTFVFVISHNFEGSNRHPAMLGAGEAGGKYAEKEGEDEREGARGQKEQDSAICWYRAQAETSCTYGGVGGMLLTGGLNLQIEHHLFPRLSSWHYPTIQGVVRECCERHGVRYSYYDYIWTNIRSMLAYMREVGVSGTLRHAADL